MCRSLRGGSGKIAVKLGSGASVTTLLHKLDSSYGIIERKETSLETFTAHIKVKEKLLKHRDVDLRLF